jgi:uncharacterized protein YggE
MNYKKNLLRFTVLISVFFISCNKNDQSETPKKIVVTGSAEMEIVPDEIFINFTLKEYLNKSRKKVKIENIKSDFLEVCEKAGILDSNISISSYTGNERWDYYWYKRRKKEPDFMASVSYMIKVNSVDKIDAIVNNMNEDAVTYFNISKTSHSKIEDLRKQIKTEALIATKDKAKYLAEAIGEEIGEALLIQEIENKGYFYNSNVISQSSMEFNDTDTSPDFKKIKLRYEMKAEFLLK